MYIYIYLSIISIDRPIRNVQSIFQNHPLSLDVLLYQPTDTYIHIYLCSYILYISYI